MQPVFESGEEIGDDDSIVSSDDDEPLKAGDQAKDLLDKAKEEETADDTPEAFVRKENQAVKIVRIIVAIVLVGAALGTSLIVFKFARDSEHDAFESEFDGVAGRLVDAMVSDVSLKLWIGRTLSSAATMVMEKAGESHLNLTMPNALFEQLTQEARFNANIFFVAWGPILSTDEERTQFEAFTATQTYEEDTDPPCYLCGDKNKGFLNPEKNVDLPGFGVFPCGPLDVAARDGVIPAENCMSVSFAVSSTCICGDVPPREEEVTTALVIPDKIFKTTDAGSVPVEYGNAPYSPIWQATALNIKKLPIMYDSMSEPVRKKTIERSLETSLPIMSESYLRVGPFYEEFHAAVSDNHRGALMYYPVFEPASDAIVGMITMEVFWESFLSGIFPSQSDKIHMVIENSCGQNFTYRVNLGSENMVLLGEGDLHDSEYSDMVHSSSFEKYEQIVDLAATVSRNHTGLDYCRYRFHVFATNDFEDVYVTNDPFVFAIITGVIFIFTSAVFVFYDLIVRRRQSKVMGAAKRTNDIVTDLFPKEVRDRMYERAQEDKTKNSFLTNTTKMQMQNFLSDDVSQTFFGTDPIADFFPHATVIFIDIAGFTAWSSEREPTQVFRLLETIYHAFDEVAKSLGVFKVETIGDSYVAVCGLPAPREKHAVIMAQFANVCLKRMKRLTRDLEKHLGPSTGELRARVGLHSGPVTAGVLRGEKARFQLFGDTVNTASRLESSGMPHRIHASKETADLLSASGKGHWVSPRRDLVQVKGKGAMQTYWLTPIAKGDRSSRGSIKSTSSTSGETFSDMRGAVKGARNSLVNSLDPGVVEARSRSLQKKNARLVEWNVEVLYKLLEKVVIARGSKENAVVNREALQQVEKGLEEQKAGKIILDEMTYILPLPSFDKAGRQAIANASIPPNVKEQMHEFINRISHLYRDVPFHNFEHASHVIMSAGKLMNRIVNPDGLDFEKAGTAEAMEIHAQTYGICSDRLMQFAVVFSALIHDVDHTGLTNAELIKIGVPISSVYRNKSIAEQNSVDVAWDVLMDDRFKDLRACLYTNEEELTHFRQLIVNAVMATDIADKELKTLRESRWDEAFSECAPEAPSDTAQVDSDRKATIIFEYIIQASDVAHTMQHWHTYQKFNRRLFAERYLAWRNGHAGEKNPSEFWYGGELWFFDNYIIPLARKLDKCGVFGVSYHEYLNYAKENKKEWEIKGHTIVAEMLESCREKYDNDDKTSDHFSDDEATCTA